MKVFASAVLLVLGSSLLTFTAVCFAVSQRAPTLSNPGFLVEALGMAGAVFGYLGARGLHGVHQTLNGKRPVFPSHTAA